jgi:hypothetical protein
LDEKLIRQKNPATRAGFFVLLDDRADVVRGSPYIMPPMPPMRPISPPLTVLIPVVHGLDDDGDALSGREQLSVQPCSIARCVAGIRLNLAWSSQPGSI